MPEEPALPIPVEEIRTILRSRGVRAARLFGSYARGEQTPGSDVDMLIDPEPGTSLLDVLRLKHELEARAGVRFELVTEIRKPFRAYVEPDFVDLGI